MPLHCYHATTSMAARSIEQTQFRPGKRGYAGAAIYFSGDSQQAVRHCFNGNSARAEVVICCSVDLGRCLPAERGTVDKDECFARGYDSVLITGTDTYAVYDSSRISIKHFTRISDNVWWYPSQKVKAKAKAKPKAKAKAKATTKAKATAKTKARPSTALETLVAAIQTSPHGSLNVTSDISQLCLKHPDLHGAIRAAGGLSGFCEAHAELIKDGHVVTMTKAKPSTALQTLVAAIQASPNGCLDVGGDMGQLCLKHPDLREAIRAAGGLSGFCEAHPELARDGSRVVLGRLSLFKQPGRSQEIEIKREEEARQMHARVRHQAEEERHQMQLQTEMRLRQEVALQVEVQRVETARQREAARQQVEKTRQQMQLFKQTPEKLYQQAQLQLEQEQDACQRRQEVRKQMQREASQQQWLLAREKDSSQQQQLQLNALSISPWGAFGSIIFGGIHAALRCLLGVP